MARVIDGDTLVCEENERVRLLLIDAPEAEQGPFGPAAEAFLSTLLPPGTRVRLETDVDPYDRYDRRLAYVYLADGRIVNRMMVRQGFAVPTVVPPNVRYIESIRAAADSARAAGIGLWAVSAFSCAPGEFRDGTCGAGTGVAVQPVAALSAVPPGANCEASYPDVCIPSPPPDLDCGDIPHRRFRVIRPDPHRFDGDHDGLGCESG
ncbi:MAG: thermonuclease family protein [Gemmatimonadota bacterium]